MENKITNTFYMKLSITELKCQALEIKKKKYMLRENFISRLKIEYILIFLNLLP